MTMTVLDFSCNCSIAATVPRLLDETNRAKQQYNTTVTMGSQRTRTSLVAKATTDIESSSMFSSALVLDNRPLAKPPSASENDRIRGRLLQRLGISSQTPSLSSSTNKHMDPSLLRPSRSVVSFEQALKDDSSLSKSACSTITTTTNPDEIHVHFRSSVKVYEIPSRHNYSNRIASKLWTPLSELQENVARNSLEFASERHDWKRVVNEDDMVVVGNELVHPIHFGILLEEFRDDDLNNNETAATVVGRDAATSEELKGDDVQV
jgi:hypothetical protein